MTKARVQIPMDVAVDLMFAADSTCCVCRSRGKAVQIHHIDEDPTNNTLENLAVLCLECHNDTQLSGGFGRKLNGALVKKHRDEWIQRVATRRDTADREAVARMVGFGIDQRYVGAIDRPSRVVPSAADRRDSILEYVNSLPDTRTELRNRAQAGWDTGVTATMVQASYDYIDALQGILVTLAGFYPEGSFGDDPHRFFSDIVASRFRWHRAHAEPDGPGTGGTIVNVTCSGNVVDDVEGMVEDMALSLVSCHS